MLLEELYKEEAAGARLDYYSFSLSSSSNFSNSLIKARGSTKSASAPPRSGAQEPKGDLQCSIWIVLLAPQS